MKKIILAPVLFFLFVSLGMAQKIDNSFFNQADKFFKANVSNGLVDYGSLSNNAQLKSLIEKVAHADLSSANEATKKAFYINAYNLNVINKVVQAYPINSVQDMNGFFDGGKVMIANETQTLNDMEKNKLLKVYDDARFHFVLVCGALGCPPITDFAYTPEQLENQLEQQTRLALNDPNFIMYRNGDLKLSQIFKWYTKDFGGSTQSIISFINKYRDEMVSNSSKTSYYPYDWSLNVVGGASSSINRKGANESRYIVSSTIPKGSVELKVFNNLYSQTQGELESQSRSSFFTTNLSAFYGLNNKFNVGLVTRFRKIRNNPAESSPFSVFGTGDDGSSRSGITAIGPQIRYAPVSAWENFSIQSSFVLPVGTDLAGSETQPYIDWTGPTWNTQFFNDFSIGNEFSLFTEIDLLIEDIGNEEEAHINRLSTPVTLIFSYVPTTKLTIYTIGSYSPYWQENFDYFAQYGIGTKYQFTPDFEIELLYTDFSNQFLINNNGQAQTINLGLRVNL